MNIERAERARPVMEEVAARASGTGCSPSSARRRLPPARIRRERRRCSSRAGRLPARARRPFFAAILRDDPPDVITPYGYGGPDRRRGFWARVRGVVPRERGVVTHLRPLPPAATRTSACAADPRRAARADGRVAGRAGTRPVRADALATTARVVRKAEHAGAERHGDEARPGRVRPTLYERDDAPASTPTAFYLLRAGVLGALERAALAPVRRRDRRRGRRQRALPREPAVAPLPPRRHRPTRAARLGAATLVLLEAARWAQEHGYERFHLGGGVGGRRDSLHEFKRRFDPGGRARVRGRQGDPRRGRLPRAQRRRRRLDGFFPRTLPAGSFARVILKAIFWASAAGLAWTHVGYPRRRRGARARARAARPQGGHRAERHPDRPRPRRGGRDRPARREPARARLPGRQARARRRLRRLDRRHRRDRRAARRAARPAAALRARREAAEHEPRRPRDRERDRRVRRRERDLGARRAAQARAQLRRPGRRLRLRPGPLPARRTARTGKASTGATSCGCARASPRSARSPAATARSTPCAAPTTSSRRSATTWASRT